MENKTIIVYFVLNNHEKIYFLRCYLTCSDKVFVNLFNIEKLIGVNLLKTILKYAQNAYQVNLSSFFKTQSYF